MSSIQSFAETILHTGSQITTVSFRDSLPFQNLLQPAVDSGMSVSGPVPIRSVPNCALGFDLNQTLLIEKLSRVNFLSPLVTNQNFRDIMRIPSLLGMDVLSRYHINFDTTFVTLEK